MGIPYLKQTTHALSINSERRRKRDEPFRISRGTLANPPALHHCQSRNVQTHLPQVTPFTSGFQRFKLQVYISTALSRILMFDTRISSSFLVHRVNLNSLKKHVTKRQAANSKLQVFPRTKCLCLLKSRNCRTVETLHLLGYLRAFINKKLSKKWSHACNLDFFLDFSNISYSYIFLIEVM